MNRRLERTGTGREATSQGTRRTLMRALAVPVVVVVLAGGFYVASRSVPSGGLVAIGAGLAWVGAAAIVFAWWARHDRVALRLVVGAVVVTALVGGYLIRPQPSEVDEMIVTGTPLAEARGSESGAVRDRARAADGGPARDGRRASDSGQPSGGGPAPEVGPTSDGAAASDSGPADSGSTDSGQASDGAPASDGTPPADGAPAPAGNVQILSGRFSGESGHSGEGKAAVVELADGRRMLTFSDFDVDAGAGSLRVYLAAGRPRSDAAVDDFVDLAELKGTTGNQQYEIPRTVDLRRYDTVVIWCVPFTTRIAQAPLV